jgi:hypothetical protein
VAVELTANWEPLERLLTPVQCAEFMWMYREDGVEHYKHIVSRRYLLLDQDGRCLARTAEGLREAPFEQEWRRVTGRTGAIALDSKLVEKLERVPVANRDLWEALQRESSRHEVTWTWVRGHGASAEQNRCDELAQAARPRFDGRCLNRPPLYIRCTVCSPNLTHSTRPAHWPSLPIKKL